MTNNGKGTLALLKLPKHLSLSLDGSRMKTLKNPQDVLVIRDTPLGFHLLAVRSANVNKVCANGGTQGTNHLEQEPSSSSSSSAAAAAAAHVGPEASEVVVPSMMTLGLTFYFHPTPSSSCSSSSSLSFDMSSLSSFVVKEYDASTEEWTSHEVDDLTKHNLYKAIESVSLPQEQIYAQDLESPRQSQSQIDASMIIHYDNFIAQEEGIHNNSSLGAKIWSKYLTNYVTMEVLHRHSLTGKGDEIIPSSYTGPSPWNDDHLVSALTSSSCGPSSSQQPHDGKVLHYPPIPMPPLSKSTTNRRDETKSVSLHHHEGTKRYLATLSPQQKTEFFLNVHQSASTPGDCLFMSILEGSYDGKWENFIGDFQLSFVLFLCCSCLSSLEHWKDVICMLSHVSMDFIGNGHGYKGGTRSGKKDAHPMGMVQMFCALLYTIYHQLDQFDCAIFDDEDYSHGNDVMPSIKCIAENCNCAYSRHATAASFHKSSDCLSTDDRHDAAEWMQLHKIATSLMTLLHIKNLVRDSDMQVEQWEFHGNHETNNTNPPGETATSYFTSLDDNEEEEDGPLVVTMEEIHESMERNASINTFHSEEYKKYKEQFPFLFAALSENEDVLMACARILDERNDATLVREAASYLEQVEAHW
eukprot:CAMPEP_0176478288 /NCGR_PEP_ID=MMETSP0200_2-20121128/1106_1 /TAXON_ID=947934 /ORGANISM="Chaetoceros sp., Strain GSL56" /LENGTH=639 /DNA_ID=CAMNT_0017874215 /DNA_START=158 /DNA_END=2074 /DNA_ORIENTATION=+